MSRKCRHTGKEIPEKRHGSAQYFSPKDYYEAKKERSKLRYKKIKTNDDEEKRNERLLNFFYAVINMGKQVTFQDMANNKFNFAFATKDLAYDREIWKVIGSYAYYIDPINKTVQIWKLSSKK